MAEASRFYQLLDDPLERSILGRWEHHLFHYTHVIGYSPTGTIFVSTEAQDDFLALYPAKPGANCKSYPVPSLNTFRTLVLDSPGFEMYSLFPIGVSTLEAVEQRLGPLGHEEIYIPAPYNFLGGSLEPETFEIGNVWVSANIIADLLNL